MTQDLSAVPIVRDGPALRAGAESSSTPSAAPDCTSGRSQRRVLEPVRSVLFSGKDTGFGVHLGAGLSASLSRRFALGLEAKYLVAQATFLDRTSNVDSAIVTVSVGYGL